LTPICVQKNLESGVGWVAVLASRVERLFDEWVRWEQQRLSEASGGVLPGLEAGIPGLLRTVTTPEFAGVRFHEVLARSALNRVPAVSRVPFEWTINPYRGCSHACTYCFARGTHSYLDFDTGEDFDREIVVKVNVVQVLRAELARPSWGRHHVALGTNTDPYQRAEGRYRLMPGVIEALAASGTSLSILTKGTLLRRDLPLLASAAERVRVGVGVSVAIVDEDLHRLLEPGTPGPRARLELVRAIRDAGLPCGVMLAPVLPWLTDSREHLTAAIGRIAAAGASGVTLLPLHLRPGAREWFFTWLERHRAELVGRYRSLYARGSYTPADYRRQLAERAAPILRAHGLAGSGGGTRTPDPAPSQPAAPVAVSAPTLW
jgi:DNA repair photolyase